MNLAKLVLLKRSGLGIFWYFFDFLLIFKSNSTWGNWEKIPDICPDTPSWSPWFLLTGSFFPQIYPRHVANNMYIWSHAGNMPSGCPLLFFLKNCQFPIGGTQRFSNSLPVHVLASVGMHLVIYWRHFYWSNVFMFIQIKSHRRSIKFKTRTLEFPHLLMLYPARSILAKIQTGANSPFSNLILSPSKD